MRITTATSGALDSSSQCVAVTGGAFPVSARASTQADAVIGYSVLKDRSEVDECICPPAISPRAVVLPQRLSPSRI